MNEVWWNISLDLVCLEKPVDLTIETSNQLIFIEAKYKTDISKITKHDPNREQILTSLQNIQLANKTELNHTKTKSRPLKTLKENKYKYGAKFTDKHPFYEQILWSATPVY